MAPFLGHYYLVVVNANNRHRLCKVMRASIAVTEEARVPTTGFSGRCREDTDDSSLIATVLNPLRHAAFVNDGNSAMTVTCIVVPPITVAVAVMVSYTDADTTRTNADIRILSICRNHDCNSDGRKQRNRQRSHLETSLDRLLNLITEETADSSNTKEVT
jgi:hypothetical protein